MLGNGAQHGAHWLVYLEDNPYSKCNSSTFLPVFKGILIYFGEKYWMEQNSWQWKRHIFFNTCNAFIFLLNVSLNTAAITKQTSFICHNEHLFNVENKCVDTNTKRSINTLLYFYLSYLCVSLVSISRPDCQIKVKYHSTSSFLHYYYRTYCRRASTGKTYEGYTVQ